LFLSGGPAADGILALAKHHGFRPYFSLSSPGFVFVSANGWSGTFWKALLTSQACAWALLGLACLLVRRTWQDKAARTSQTRLRWGHWWRFGGAKRRLSLRRKLLDVNPILWLACRERWQSLAVWIVAVLVLGSCVGMIVSGLPQDFWMLWNWFGNLFTLVLYLWTASQASKFFIEAKRNGLLELLLVVPLSGRDIIAGPWRALLRLFAAPLAVFLLAHFVALTVSQRAMWRTLGTGMPALPDLASRLAMAVATAGATVVVVAANLAAICWFGMWMGLTSKNNHFAALKTILFVQVVPSFVIWIAASSAVSLLIIPSLLQGFAAGPPSSFMFWYPLLSLAVSTVLALAKDFFFWKLARRKLFENFREIATRAVSPLRLAPAPPLVKPAP
jgi:hypothetical protein